MFRSSDYRGYTGKRIDIIHSIYRTIGDLKMLRHMGYRDLLSTMILPVTLTSGRSYYDFFTWATTEECKRYAEFNLHLHPLIGIPPAGLINPKVLDEAVAYLEEFIIAKKIVGIGEIGMGSGTKEEYLTMKNQLVLAQKYNLPAIIQAPRVDKVALTSIILKELKKANIDRAIINHCDVETLQLVVRAHDARIKAGITVGQQATSPEDAIRIFREHSHFDRIVINSSLGLKDSSLFGLNSFIELYEDSDLNIDFLGRMCHDNYVDVFPHLATQIKVTF